MTRIVCLLGGFLLILRVTPRYFKIVPGGFAPTNFTNTREQNEGIILQVTWCYLKFEKMLSRIGMLLGSK